jgi:exosortase/archaeosortase family protein
MTMVLAHPFLRSWWRKALLIAAAIPLTLAKNGLRIFVIAELGTRVDPGFLNGNLQPRRDRVSCRLQWLW